jgi:uncharacterized protein YqeY
MSLSEAALRADLKNAMLAKDAIRTRVVRAILAAAKNAAIEKRAASLEDQELVGIVKREVKQRNETIDFARQGGRDDTVAELQAEIAVLEDYLPKQLGEVELRAAIETIAADTGATSIGPVMKELSQRYPGRYDGKLASTIAQETLKK